MIFLCSVSGSIGELWLTVHFSYVHLFRLVVKLEEWWLMRQAYMYFQLQITLNNV